MLSFSHCLHVTRQDLEGQENELISDDHNGSWIFFFLCLLWCLHYLLDFKTFLCRNESSRFMCQTSEFFGNKIANRMRKTCLVYAWGMCSSTRLENHSMSPYKPGASCDLISSYSQDHIYVLLLLCRKKPICDSPLERQIPIAYIRLKNVIENF